MRSREARVFWGVVFVVLGVGLILVNLGLLSPQSFAFWPLLVFLLGLWITAQSLRRPAGQGLTAGVVAMAIGGFWFAESVNWVDEGWFLAVLLISLGLGLLLRTVGFRHR